ncbi:uncharacterized protein [Euwallacea similis]|uniref:uncharacterized protein n=1 Tax=Euwallacea similis TaxID=1736056 RepID=UPI00344C9C97
MLFLGSFISNEEYLDRNMPKTRDLSSENPSKLIFLYEQGHNQVEIAKLIKCSRCAVQNTIHRFKLISTNENLRRSGRKRLTSSKENRLLIRSSLTNRRQTNAFLAFCTNDKKTSRSRIERLLWNTIKLRKRIGLILCGLMNLILSGVTFVRRRRGGEYLPEYVVPTVKHGGSSIVV